MPLLRGCAGLCRRDGFAGQECGRLRTLPRRCRRLGQSNFAAPGDLEHALDRIASYSADDLTRGWIAYSALAASHASSFAAGIASARKASGKSAVAAALRADATYASRRRGYGDAAAAITSLAAADSRASRAAADALETAAPHLVWADAMTNESRGEHLNALGSSPTLRESPRGGPANVRRIASVAGLALLGDASASKMLDDRSTRACIVMEQLQFYQCVSVTRDATEGALCMAAHAIRGVRHCLDLAAR